MIKIYDDQFNNNEWFVLITLTIGIIAMWKSPKIFPPHLLVLFFFFSVVIGLIFDHTISVKPFDFYDVNDTSKYQLMDFLSYVMYGPFGYFFVYLYEKYKISNRWNTLYILGWALFALGLEKLADINHLFHYKNGYDFFYGFPIYLGVLTIHLVFYKQIMKEENKTAKMTLRKLNE